MLQSIGSQTIGHDLATEQQDPYVSRASGMGRGRGLISMPRWAS